MNKPKHSDIMMSTQNLDKKNISIQKFLKENTSLDNKVFVSYEITTNIKELDIKNGNLNDSLFVSVVWTGKLAKFKLLENDSSLKELFDLLQKLKEMNKRTMVHLTCYQMTFEKLKYILEKLRSFDVVDLLVLRGDGDEFVEFKNALELMEAINNNKNYPKFNLAIAGYPQGHPESLSVQQDFEILKKKIESGPGIIITQFFFNAMDFINFVENCHNIYDIHIPIIPGILLAPSYAVLEKISGMAKVSLPSELINVCNFDNKQFEEYYTEFIVKLVSEILEFKYLDCSRCSFQNVKGIHLFTMNNFKMTNEIVDFLKSRYKLLKM